LTKESRESAPKPYRILLVASMSLCLAATVVAISVAFLTVPFWLENIADPMATFEFLTVGFYGALIAIVAGASWFGVVIGRVRLRKGKSFWITYSLTVSPVVLFFIINYSI